MNLIPKTTIIFNTFDYKLIPNKDSVSVSGERNATLFIIPVPKLFLKPDFVYHVLFETSKGHKKRSKPLTPNENGEIETYLPREFSKPSKLKIQLVVISAGQTLKTLESPFMSIESSILASEEVEADDLNLLEGAILKFNEAQDKLPYIDDETGTWFVYDLSLGEYVDTGKKAVESGGSSGGSSSPADNKFRKVGVILREVSWQEGIDEGYPFVLRCCGADSANTQIDMTFGKRMNSYVDIIGTYHEAKRMYMFDVPYGYDNMGYFALRGRAATGGHLQWQSNTFTFPPPHLYKNVGLCTNVNDLINGIFFDLDDMSRHIFYQAQDADLIGTQFAECGSYTDAPNNKFLVPFDKCWGAIRANPESFDTYRRYLCSAKVPLYDKDDNFVDDFRVVDKDGNPLSDFVQINYGYTPPNSFTSNLFSCLIFYNDYNESSPLSCYNAVTDGWANYLLGLNYGKDALVYLDNSIDVSITNLFISAIGRNTMGKGFSPSMPLYLQKHFEMHFCFTTTVSTLYPAITLNSEYAPVEKTLVFGSALSADTNYYAKVEGFRLTETLWKINVELRAYSVKTSGAQNLTSSSFVYSAIVNLPEGYIKWILIRGTDGTTLDSSRNFKLKKISQHDAGNYDDASVIIKGY